MVGWPRNRQPDISSTSSETISERKHHGAERNADQSADGDDADIALVGALRGVRNQRQRGQEVDQQQQWRGELCTDHAGGQRHEDQRRPEPGKSACEAGDESSDDENDE
jgi:hypothetical protein